MNLQSIILVVIIAAAFAAAAYKIIKDRNNPCRGCSGNCGKCNERKK